NVRTYRLGALRTPSARPAEPIHSSRSECMPESTEIRAPRRILTEISSTTWEHPADRAALAALRRIPVFDQVLKAIFGIVGEKPMRLAFQANAVRVSPKQFPHIHAHYCAVLETM